MSARGPTVEELQRRLEELQRRLIEKEAELIELQMSVQAGKEFLERAHHRELETDLDPLPVPRLELRCEPVDDGTEWVYSLVYKHFLGHIVFVTVGITRVSGARIVEPVDGRTKLQLPMRDGVHIYHDMKELRLPGFAICGETIEQLQPYS